MENLKLSQILLVLLFKYTRQFNYDAKFKGRTKRRMKITGPRAYTVYKREVIL